MPKLWSDTIAAHRRHVHDAIIDSTVTLVAEHGVRSVTMSQIAEETGIGRATLYKYFPRVEAILVAWHERQIAAHLEQLAELRETASEPLEAVLDAFAHIQHEQRGNELAGVLHRGPHVARAQRQLEDLVREVIQLAQTAGDVRDDVASEELATYCLHALAAAGRLSSKDAVRRLVAVTMAGLRPSG